MTDNENMILFDKLFPGQLYRVLKPDKSPLNSDLVRSDAILNTNKLVGWEVPKEYVALDFDTLSQAEAVVRIIKDSGLNCCIFKTRKGYHFVFKNHRRIDFHNGVYCALGFRMDVRTNMKGYIMLPYNDPAREWIKISDNIDKIPAYLIPLKALRESPDFMEVDVGSRNDRLFKHVINLLHFAKELAPNEKQNAIITINKYLLKDPMTSKELDTTVLRNELISAIQEQKARELSEEEYANKIIADNQFIIYNEQLFRYNEQFYETVSDEQLHTLIHDKYTKTFKHKNREETIKFIKVKLNADKDKPTKLPWNLLNVKNGILDVKTGTLLPFTRDIFSITQLPVEWKDDNEVGMSETVFNFIHNAANCDPEVETLFYEIVASCLVDTRLFDKFFILLGEGGTGKSTFLNMIGKLLGPQNVSHLTIHELNHQFLLPELSGKKANLGDDIEHGALENCAILKKLVANEPVEVNKKFQNPFTLINNATLIFTANKMPYISERTSGIYRRLMIIPMNVKIQNTDFEFISKLGDVDMEYLLNRAVRALQEMLKRNSFISPRSVEDELKVYIRYQSNSLTFLFDRNYDAFKVNGVSETALYEEYKVYCFDNGLKAQSKQNFVSDVLLSLNVEIRQLPDKFGNNKVNRFIIKEKK